MFSKSRKSKIRRNKGEFRYKYNPTVLYLPPCSLLLSVLHYLTHTQHLYLAQCTYLTRNLLRSIFQHTLYSNVRVQIFIDYMQASLLIASGMVQACCSPTQLLSRNMDCKKNPQALINVFPSNCPFDFQNIVFLPFALTMIQYVGRFDHSFGLNIPVFLFYFTVVGIRNRI